MQPAVRSTSSGRTAFGSRPQPNAEVIAPGPFQIGIASSVPGQFANHDKHTPPHQSSDSNGNGKALKEESTHESSEVPFTTVEEMPMFPGGEAALLNYIGANIKYPEAAKEKNIQGKVIIRFCITPKGSVSMISVIQGVSPELDEEGIRVVSTLPAFKPGRHEGKEVPVWYMVPIKFSLK